ncbi:MAG: hypothetical protein ACE15E_04020 [Acidobacteriota bacterium]
METESVADFSEPADFPAVEIMAIGMGPPAPNIDTLIPGNGNPPDSLFKREVQI